MTFSFPHAGRDAACIVAFLLMCAAPVSQAEQGDAQPDVLMHEKASLRFGVENIMLPGDEKMGMLGTTYLIEVAPNIYFGPAAYSSIRGLRGGFYTGGGELEARYRIGSRLDLQTGVYVGGGGGGSSLVGGGMMVRPHIDLMWDFGGYRAGVSASQVNFPNGYVKSNQLGVLLDFDTQFSHTGAGYMNRTSNIVGRTGVGFDRVLGFYGAYKPRAGTTMLGGAPMQSSIGYVGTRMERMLTPNVYAGIEATGANSGGVAGYAEFLGTMGVEMPVISDRLTLGTRVALGTGGGGGVWTGGGLLTKASLYATASMTRDFHLTLEGGVADAPNGNFRANFSTLSVRWDLDHPHSIVTTSKPVANEWIGGVQRYIKAARKNGTVADMDSVTLKLNRHLTESWYLTGQAHSAYQGHAGGYSVGLIGAGYRTPIKPARFYAGAEFAAGAAGGGSVDTRGGVVMQPMVYVGLGLSKSVSLRLSAGRIKAKSGNLDSNLFDLGLAYSFGTTSRN